MFGAVYLFNSIASIEDDFGSAMLIFVLIVWYCRLLVLVQTLNVFVPKIRSFSLTEPAPPL
jgi:hypothetical protein